MEERHSNEGLWKKDTVMKDYGRKTQFDKKGSDIIHNESDVERGENRRDCNGKIVETFLEERSVFGGNNRVWREPGRHGSCIKNKRDNRIVIKKHNICRRPKRSVLPRTLEEKESPLHVTKIEPMSILYCKGNILVGKNPRVFIIFLNPREYFPAGIFPCKQIFFPAIFFVPFCEENMCAMKESFSKNYFCCAVW